MNKNVLIGWLVVCAVCLAVLCLVQHRALKRLRAESAAVTVSVAEERPATVAPEPIVVSEEDSQDDLFKVPRKRTMTDMLESSFMEKHRRPPREEEPVLDFGEPEETATNQSPLQALAALMSTPEVRESLREQAAAEMEPQYSALYERLQLPEKKLAAFKDILAEKISAEMDLGFEAMAAMTDTNRIAEIREREKTLKKEYDDKILKLIGEEKFGIYQQFERTQPERSQVRELGQVLEGVGMPLTKNQEHDLVMAMHEERTNGFDDVATRSFDPAAFTAEGAEKTMRDLARLQEKNRLRAGKILTEGQLKCFEQFQERQRLQFETALKMMTLMTAPEGQEGASSPGTPEEVE